MIRRMIALPVLIVLAILAYAWLAPAQNDAKAVTVPTPTVSTPSLPPCLTEDGAGQALCYWDAATQGNGRGTSVVSGDCAPSVVGSEASPLCVRVHAMPSDERTNADGSTDTIPNGADLVGECIEIDKEMTAQEKIEDGFSLYHCFNAYID